MWKWHNIEQNLDMQIIPGCICRLPHKLEINCKLSHYPLLWMDRVDRWTSVVWLTTVLGWIDINQISLGILHCRTPLMTLRAHMELCYNCKCLNSIITIDSAYINPYQYFQRLMLTQIWLITWIMLEVTHKQIFLFRQLPGLSTLLNNPGDSRFWTVSPGLQIRVWNLPDNRQSLPFLSNRLCDNEISNMFALWYVTSFYHSSSINSQYLRMRGNDSPGYNMNITSIPQLLYCHQDHLSTVL